MIATILYYEVVVSPYWLLKVCFLLRYKSDNESKTLSDKKINDNKAGDNHHNKAAENHHTSFNVDSGSQRAYA